MAFFPPMENPTGFFVNPEKSFEKDAMYPGYIMQQEVIIPRGFKSRIVTRNKTMHSVHCYKTFRRIPPPSPDDARLILLYRGKRLLYMGRVFAPSGTEVFRNIRKFPAIFTIKKGRTRMVGSNSVPLDYYSSPLPLDHGYTVINIRNKLVY